MLLANFIAASDGGFVCFLIGVGVLIAIGIFGGNGTSSSGSGSSSRTSPSSVPNFMVKAEVGTIGTGNELESCVRVYCQGRVPVSYPQDVSVLVTVEDVGGPKGNPVVVMMPQFQDKLTRHYRDSADLGRFEVGTYLNQWACVGIVPTAHLVGPYGGSRRLETNCFCVPTSLIKLPLGDTRLWQGVICASSAKVSAHLPLTGYLEMAEKSRDAKAAIVELAMACAGTDGSFDERELRVVQKWMRSVIAEFGADAQDDREKMRGVLNEAFKRGTSGTADINAASARLRQLSMPAMSQSALSLCVEVIAADGELHQTELKTVRAIATSLGLDYDKLQVLMDKQFVKSGISVAQDNLEALVGIDPAWDKERIRKHLADQFMKWNSRAPSAKTVEDQSRIRAMLEAIAKLKKKYA